MSRGLRTLCAALLVGVLGLTACSSDEDSAADGAATTSAAGDRACPSALDASASDAAPDGAAAADGPVDGPLRHEVAVGDQQREYVVWLPADRDPAVPLPVVADFHGAGGSAEGHVAVSGTAELGTARGYLVVAGQAVAAPGASGVGWQKSVDEQPDDIGYLRAVLDALDAEYCIDRERVFATGFSSGAGFSAFASCELPELAAVAPLAGVNLVRPCVDAPLVPVISFHGDADTFVAFDGVAGIDDVAGTSPSFIGDVTEVMDVWAERNGCDATRPVEQPGEGSTVRTYADCPDGAEVVLHVLPGADHIYPGGKQDSGDGDVYVPGDEGYSAVPAAELVLDFFDQH